MPGEGESAHLAAERNPLPDNCRLVRVTETTDHFRVFAVPRVVGGDHSRQATAWKAETCLRLHRAAVTSQQRDPLCPRMDIGRDVGRTPHREGPEPNIERDQNFLDQGFVTPAHWRRPSPGSLKGFRRAGWYPLSGRQATKRTRTSDRRWAPRQSGEGQLPLRAGHRGRPDCGHRHRREADTAANPLAGAPRPPGSAQDVAPNQVDAVEQHRLAINPRARNHCQVSPDGRSM